MVDPKKHEDDLLRSGLLNLADLEINRSGNLSDRQKIRLYAWLAFWLGLTIVYVILLIAFISFQIVTQGNFLLGLAGITFLLTLISTSLEEAKPYGEDIREDLPRTVSGRVEKSVSVTHGPGRGQSVGHCNLRIGDQIFSVSPFIYDHVDEIAYRIYFVPNTRKIINIEPL